VLFVSRLHPANRVDMLIQATASLVPQIPGVKTVIVGNGEPEKSRLKELARRHDVHERVVFVDGVYDEMKLAPWFLSAKVFCYPANIGLSLIHALWYGVPVVTSDNLEAQNPEIVALESGTNGLLYSDGNQKSLDEALRAILCDPARQASMSQAARSTVEGKFTISNMVDGMEATIRFAYGTLTAGAKKAHRGTREPQAESNESSFVQSRS
jgi:glycosyltransferase involved in cell wall biosynthesis